MASCICPATSPPPCSFSPLDLLLGDGVQCLKRRQRLARGARVADSLLEFGLHAGHRPVGPVDGLAQSDHPAHDFCEAVAPDSELMAQRRADDQQQPGHESRKEIAGQRAEADHRENPDDHISDDDDLIRAHDYALVPPLLGRRKPAPRRGYAWASLKASILRMLGIVGADCRFHFIESIFPQ